MGFIYMYLRLVNPMAWGSFTSSTVVPRRTELKCPLRTMPLARKLRRRGRSIHSCAAHQRSAIGQERQRKHDENRSGIAQRSWERLDRGDDWITGGGTCGSKDFPS